MATINLILKIETVSSQPFPQLTEAVSIGRAREQRGDLLLTVIDEAIWTSIVPIANAIGRDILRHEIILDSCHDGDEVTWQIDSRQNYTADLLRDAASKNSCFASTGHIPRAHGQIFRCDSCGLIIVKVK